MPIHLERVLNRARLETESYSISLTWIHQIEMIQQQVLKQNTKVTGPYFGFGSPAQKLSKDKQGERNTESTKECQQPL